MRQRATYVSDTRASAIRVRQQFACVSNVPENLHEQTVWIVLIGFPVGGVFYDVMTNAG
jgi:hypothetical protein